MLVYLVSIYHFVFKLSSQPLALHHSRSFWPRPLSKPRDSLRSHEPTRPCLRFTVNVVTCFLFLCCKGVLLSLCFSPFYFPSFFTSSAVFSWTFFLPAPFFFSSVFFPSFAFFRMDRWGVVPSAHWGLGMEMWLDGRSDFKISIWGFVIYKL